MKPGTAHQGVGEQPTFKQLSDAFNAACLAPSLGDGAKVSAIARLRSLREQKHTWVFREENDLRREIDRLLEESTTQGAKNG